MTHVHRTCYRCLRLSKRTDCALRAPAGVSWQMHFPTLAPCWSTLPCASQEDSSHAEGLRLATIDDEAVAGRRCERCERAAARRQLVLRVERPLADCRSSVCVRACIAVRSESVTRDVLDRQ